MAENRKTWKKIKELPPEKYLRAGDALDIIYSSGGEGEYIRKVTCYEVFPEQKQLVVSQPSPGVRSYDINRRVHITKVSRIDADLIRVGTTSVVSSLQKDYELSKGQRVVVVNLVYEPQLRKFNLRTSYRLEPTRTYQVNASIRLSGGTVIPESTVKVKDVSTAGVGLELSKQSLDPKLVDSLKTGEVLTLDLKLLDNEHSRKSENHSDTIKCESEIVRVRSLREPDVLALGTKFRNMKTSADERPLATFITAAQRHILRKARNTG